MAQACFILLSLLCHGLTHMKFFDEFYFKGREQMHWIHSDVLRRIKEQIYWLDIRHGKVPAETQNLVYLGKQRKELKNERAKAWNLLPGAGASTPPNNEENPTEIEQEGVNSDLNEEAQFRDSSDSPKDEMDLSYETKMNNSGSIDDREMQESAGSKDDVIATERVSVKNESIKVEGFVNNSQEKLEEVESVDVEKLPVATEDEKLTDDAQDSQEDDGSTDTVEEATAAGSNSTRLDDKPIDELEEKTEEAVGVGTDKVAPDNFLTDETFEEELLDESYEELENVFEELDEIFSDESEKDATESNETDNERRTVESSEGEAMNEAAGKSEAADPPKERQTNSSKPEASKQGPDESKSPPSFENTDEDLIDFDVVDSKEASSKDTVASVQTKPEPKTKTPEGLLDSNKKDVSSDTNSTEKEAAAQKKEKRDEESLISQRASMPEKSSVSDNMQDSFEEESIVYKGTWGVKRLEGERDFSLPPDLLEQYVRSIDKRDTDDQSEVDKTGGTNDDPLGTGFEAVPPNKSVNTEFVEGLDDINKFMEAVDPPDELDVGAAGSSIQEVLVGQGLRILMKRVGLGMTYIRKQVGSRAESFISKRRNQDGKFTLVSRERVDKTKDKIRETFQQALRGMRTVAEDLFGMGEEEDMEFDFNFEQDDFDFEQDDASGDLASLRERLLQQQPEGDGEIDEEPSLSRGFFG